MGEDGRAVALDMLIEPDAGRALARIDASVALRTWSGSRRIRRSTRSGRRRTGTRPHHAGGSGYARTMRARCHRTRRLPHR
jgi:hypothetical protein